jgi:hypothetical protein
MEQRLTCLAAAFLVLLMVSTSTAAAATGPVISASSRSTVSALSPVVDAVVAETRPLHWPMKRACLYYAFAGQALLVELGIAARLRVGQVVYWPGTATAHRIAPHAWLETATDFVDYAMLPRLGRTAIIPRQRVAAEPSAVVPGFTRVLAVEAELDDPLRLYLSHHHRRFNGGWVAARRRPSVPPLPPFQRHPAGAGQLSASPGHGEPYKGKGKGKGRGIGQQ